MLYSFRKQENLKVKIVFQRKLFTLCMCFLFLCSVMQLAIQRYVITPRVGGWVDKLYLNTITVKAKSLWGRVFKFNFTKN